MSHFIDAPLRAIDCLRHRFGTGQAPATPAEKGDMDLAGPWLFLRAGALPTTTTWSAVCVSNWAESAFTLIVSLVAPWNLSS